MATNKPAIEPIWASASALKADPGTSKINTGWIVEKPPVGWMNWLQARFNEYLAHVNERGIPQWDTDTTYLIKALVYGSNGTKYEAVQENDGNNPTTDDGTYWIPFGGGIMIPKVLPGKISNDGVLTIGNEKLEEIEYTGAAIDANVTNVTDIDDPEGTGGWTDLFEITGARYAIQSAGAGALVNSYFELVVDSTETAGDSLRGQVLIDGIIAWDGKVVRTTATDSYAKWEGGPLDPAADTKETFGVNSSLLIRVARKGAFTDATSKIQLLPIYYTDIL